MKFSNQLLILPLVYLQFNKRDYIIILAHCKFVIN